MSRPIKWTVEKKEIAVKEIQDKLDYYYGVQQG